MLPRNKTTLATANIRMNFPWRFSRNGRHEEMRPMIPPPRRFSKNGLSALLPIGDSGEEGDDDRDMICESSLSFLSPQGLCAVLVV